MPTIVELPDQTELEFPDGMDELSMHQAIVKAFPDLARPTPSESPGVPAPGKMGGQERVFVPSGFAGSMPNPKAESLRETIEDRQKVAPRVQQYTPERWEKIETPVHVFEPPPQPPQFELPRFGDPGTFGRGVSETVAGLGEWVLNNPEEFIASIYPPTQAAVLLRYAPSIINQVAHDSWKAMNGDMEALGRVTGVAGLVFGPKAASEARAKFYTEGRPRQPVPSPDVIAREAMRPDQPAREVEKLPTGPAQELGTVDVDRLFLEPYTAQTDKELAETKAATAKITQAQVEKQPEVKLEPLTPTEQAEARADLVDEMREESTKPAPAPEPPPTAPDVLAELRSIDQLPYGPGRVQAKLGFITRTSQVTKEFARPTNGDEYWVSKVEFDPNAIGYGAWKVTIETPKGPVIGGAQFAEALNNPDMAAAKAFMVEMGGKLKGDRWALLEGLASMNAADRLAFKLPGNTLSASLRREPTPPAKVEAPEPTYAKSTTKPDVVRGIPDGAVEEGLNTEHPDVAQSLDKYTHDNESAGIKDALAEQDYESYKADLNRLLEYAFGDWIQVTRKTGYAGTSGQGVGDYVSVSTNPTWKGEKYWVHRNDVAFAGNEAEGELIVRRSGLKTSPESTPPAKVEAPTKPRELMTPMEYGLWRAGEGRSAAPGANQASDILVAMRSKLPVNAEAANLARDAVEKTDPNAFDGYVKEGDQYVYKPEAKPAAETGKERGAKPWSVPWADGRARAWFKTKESADEFYRQKAREGDVDGPPTQEVEPTQGVKYADEKYPPKSEQERTIIELEDQLKSIKQRRREVRANYKGVKPVSTMNRTTPKIERGQAFQRELDNLEMEETGVSRQLQQLKQQAEPVVETAPVAAAAKVEQEVKSVAKTEGQRSAKERPLPPYDPSSQALGITPPLSPFMREDVLPAAQAIAKGIVQSVRGLRNLLAPATAGPSAQLGAGIIREHAGKLAQKDVQMRAQFAEAHKAMARMDKAETLNWTDAVEGGRRSTLTGPLRRFADEARDALDDRRRQIQALGTGKLQHFIQDYFPHLWKNPDGALSWLQRIFGRRPLRGPASFLKHRTIPTTRQGVDAGLEPASWNPMDIMLAKIHEMDRYIMGQKIFNEFKDKGLAVFSRSDVPPEGYAPINDRIANVIQYRPTVKADGTPGAPERILRGHYFVQEDAARVLNNFLSPGLERYAWYKALRWVGNNMNMATLGLSGYHGMFTMIDSGTSKLSLGIEQAARGDYRGLGNIPRGLVGTLAVNQLEAFYKGSKVLQEYTKPGSVGGEYAEIVDSLIAAGGRVQMPQIYQNSTLHNFGEALRKGNYTGAVIRAPAAALHAFAYPLMNVVVPRLKLGVFSDMARIELEKLGPTATRDQVRASMGKIWDSVDNRMGELVYDNLFWHKALKDLSFLAIRSVGWNLGTLRELGGGVLDTATVLKRIQNGDPVMTRRVAYCIALPFTVGMMGAIYQYLRTGKGPEDFEDYFFPRTGNTLAEGQPERVSFPSYLKDVESIKRHPAQTVLNKMHPMWGTISQMLQNKDYYGTEIMHPGDPLVDQVRQELAHVAKSFIPYGISGAEKRAKVQEGIEPKVESFFGIMPVPAELTRTPAENEAMQLMRQHLPQGARTRADFERLSKERDAIQQIKMGKMTIEQAEQQGLIQSHRVKAVQQRSEASYLEYSMKHLSIPEAMRVLEKANPQEVKSIAEDLEGRINRSRNLEPEDKDRYIGMLNKLRKRKQ